MKETLTNLKKVYNNYGKEYKSALIKITIFSIYGIFTNIVIPLLSAKFIISFTDSKFKQAVFMSIIILIVGLFERTKILLIRK